MTAPIDQPYPPTPAQYGPGSIKQDCDLTYAVAVRTRITTFHNNKDWLIATIDHGGHYGPWDEVSNWYDICTWTAVAAAFSGEGTLAADVASQRKANKGKKT